MLETNLSDSVQQLDEYLQTMDIPLFFVLAPVKEDLEGDLLPEPFHNYQNDTGDHLLTLLSEKGVDTLDLRTYVSQNGEQSGKYFYRTDHHWNGDGALLGFEVLMDELKNRYDPTLDTTYVKPDDWNDGDVIEYPRYGGPKTPRAYQSVEDLPTDVLNDHNRYPKELIYDATKNLWTWWAIVANQKEQKKYVVVETASGFRRWYEVRKFVRSGYFIYDEEAIKRYGRIEKIIDFQDAHNLEYLEEAALQYLYNAKFEEYSLDLTAIDAQLLTENSDLERILDVMDPAKTYSTFHDVSLLLPIEEIEIPFNDLGNMSFTLSFSTTQRITSTIAAKKR